MRQEKGLYIVLFALLLFVLLGLVALALGLGFLGTSKTRLQNGVNLAALAALEKFAGLPITQSYQDRANTARDRANDILTANTTPGTQRSLGQLNHHGSPDPDDSGTITFGNWYQKKPSPTFDPCLAAGLTYPCFIANADPSATVSPTTPMNAVQIEAHNQGTNPFMFRLGRFLGKDSFILASNAIATVVPRCTAYVMDVSASSFFETHPSLDPSVAPTVNSCVGPGYTCPDPFCVPGCLAGTPGCYGECNPYKTVDITINQPNFGLGAYRDGPRFTPTDDECINYLNYIADPGSPLLSKQTVYWCNTPHLDPGRDPHRSSPPSGNFRHYQSDYELEDSPLPEGGIGKIWVDKLFVGTGAGDPDPVYDGPQPYTRNFLAFNAGLRQVQSTTVGGDLSFITAFTGQPRSYVPATGLTPDLGFLIQLTNLDNRGKRDYLGNQVTPEIHPNFIDFGWAPFPGELYDATSAVGNAVLFAADRLHESCPAASRKAILLASDGVMNTHFSLFPTPYGGSSYPNYQAALAQLLNDPIGIEPAGGGGTRPPILQQLKDYEISLSMIMDGSHVNPNFLNIASGECGAWVFGAGFGTDDPKCYFSFQEAYAHGIAGYRAPNGLLFDSGSYNGSTPALPSDAYDNAGRVAGWTFGDPMGVWSDVAFETGGFFCPLLAPMPGVVNDNYVDFYGDRGPFLCDQECTGHPCSPCVLKSMYRDPRPGSNVQKYAPVYMRKGEQAAQCARNAVGLNPFTLVEKDT